MHNKFIFKQLSQLMEDKSELIYLILNLLKICLFHFRVLKYFFYFVKIFQHSNTKIFADLIFDQKI